MDFNPEQYYSVNRMPRRRSLLRAASRDYEVYFTDIESVLDRLREIFNHVINKLISEIQEDLPGHSHRIRLVLNAPTLNYPIHKSFSSSDDFNAELVLNEIDRVVSLNEASDISNNIKVNVLSVSLPEMGGKRIGGIQSRTVPDIKLFTKQKKSVIVIKSFKNDCLIKALAIGKKVCHRAIVEPLAKNSNKNHHMDRASTQMRKMQILLRALEKDPSFDQDRLTCDIPIGSSLDEMTVELPNDVLIDKFWSAGPKFYCLSGHNVNSGLGYNVFIVKAVTLNRTTEKTFNPKTF